MMRKLLDVVHQTVELPLRIHFLLPSESETVELLVVTDVAKTPNCKDSSGNPTNDRVTAPKVVLRRSFNHF
jgi:hypothetical protein